MPKTKTPLTFEVIGGGEPIVVSSLDEVDEEEFKIMTVAAQWDFEFLWEQRKRDRKNFDEFVADAAMDHRRER